MQTPSNPSPPDPAELIRTIATHVPELSVKSMVVIAGSKASTVRQIGSGTLLAVADLRFVLTAAHVVREGSRLGLLSLNQAFDTRLVDLLLTLHKLKRVWVSGNGVLQCAPGIASGLIKAESRVNADNYFVCLTEKGQRFVSAWEAGNEQAAISAV